MNNNKPANLVNGDRSAAAVYRAELEGRDFCLFSGESLASSNLVSDEFSFSNPAIVGLYLARYFIGGLV